MWAKKERLWFTLRPTYTFPMPLRVAQTFMGYDFSREQLARSVDQERLATTRA